MDMYIDYCREREGKSVIVTEDGFIKYFIEKDILFIDEFYIKPSSRHKGLGQSMVDGLVTMAKSKGCAQLMGAVVPSTKGADRNVRIFMEYGMTIHSAVYDRIYLVKEI